MTDGTTTWNYTYDANGMRTQRSNGTTTYNYVYNGSQLTQMTVGNDTLYFTYGILGPTTVTWNGTTYYYALNGQGDVTGIFDEVGNLVVFYYFENAWGYNPVCEGPMASTLGVINPLHYRGYVYDQEIGYYYLQSRYYDPEIGRFINADVQLNMDDGILGANLFAYCLNNPANQEDPSGTASYQNSYTVNKENGKVSAYYVTTVIKIGWTKLTYKYTITADGIIKFEFNKNNYWSLLWRGGGRILAEAMYKQAKAINRNFLYGRTIGGIHTELQGHWAAYQVTRSERARVADMGALTKGKRGYDSNAWFWEGGNGVKIVGRISIFGVRGYVGTIYNLTRYL